MEAYGFWGKLNSEAACEAELMKMYQQLVEQEKKIDPAKQMLNIKDQSLRKTETGLNFYGDPGQSRTGDLPLRRR